MAYSQSGGYRAGRLIAIKGSRTKIVYLLHYGRNRLLLASPISRWLADPRSLVYCSTLVYVDRRVQLSKQSVEYSAELYLFVFGFFLQFILNYSNNFITIILTIAVTNDCAMDVVRR